MAKVRHDKVRTDYGIRYVWTKVRNGRTRPPMPTVRMGKNAQLTVQYVSQEAFEL